MNLPVVLDIAIGLIFIYLMGEVGLGRLSTLAGILLGWLVTGVAIAMGAPFWFDLMSKLMNVRNTGTKPASISEKDTSR